MGLKSMFSALKNEGYILKNLDLYLLSLAVKDEDRAINVNAPSAIGTCLRARYYSRTGAPCDTCAVDARTRRIFDNGTHVHLRLQDYLKAQGMLLMDEVPVISDEYTIQGHTDGILDLSHDELGVLEIKSINSRNFTELKTAKPEHKMQGLVYLYCLEQWRQMLQSKYKTEEEFKKSSTKRSMKYRKYYLHLKDGHKFTREQKINFQVHLLKELDNILYYCKKPLTKVVFLYENKDTQDLKEYAISSNDPQSAETIKGIIEDCEYLNDIIDNNGDIPPRCASSKSDNACRWCNYKTECWN